MDTNKTKALYCTFRFNWYSTTRNSSISMNKITNHIIIKPIISKKY